MEYLVVTGKGMNAVNAIAAMTEKLREKLNEGWKPHGSMTMTLEEHGWIVAAQPITKKAETEAEPEWQG